MSKQHKSICILINIILAAATAAVVYLGIHFPVKWALMAEAGWLIVVVLVNLGLMKNEEDIEMNLLRADRAGNFPELTQAILEDYRYVAEQESYFMDREDEDFAKDRYRNILEIVLDNVKDAIFFLRNYNPETSDAADLVYLKEDVQYQADCVAAMIDQENEMLAYEEASDEMM